MTMKYFWVASLVLASQAMASQFEPPYSLSRERVQIEVQANGESEIRDDICHRVKTQVAVGYLGEWRLTFISTMEQMDVLDAYTQLPNGERIPVAKDRILLQDGDGDGESVIHTDIKSYLIVYPRVEVGADLCYSTRTVQAKPYFGRHFSWTRYFSPHLNHDSSEFVLTAAPQSGVSVDMKGVDAQPMEVLPDGRHRWRFQYQYAKAHPKEPDQVSYLDFAPFISISTFKNYAELAVAYQSGLKGKTDASPAIKNLVKDLTKGLTDDLSKVAVIHNWVSQNIRYLGIYWADGGYVPHAATEVFQNRYGDCKDHALLLEVMLKEAGIESTPVLIFLGKRFVLPKQTVMSAFNHVITYVPSLDAYLDSTARFAPMSTLPVQAMDKFALHVSDGKIYKTRPGDVDTESTLTMTKWDLRRDGSLLGEAISSAKGSFDLRLREIRFVDQGRTNEALSERYMGRYMERGHGFMDPSEPDRLNQPLEVVAHFEMEPLVNIPGPSALTLPTGMVMGWIRGVASKNQIQHATHPFTCAPRKHVDQIQVRLPRGIQLMRLPSDVQVKRGPFSYTARYVRKGNLVRVQRTYAVETQSHVCDASLNDDFNAVLKAMRRDMRAQFFIQ